MKTTQVHCADPATFAHLREAASARSHAGKGLKVRVGTGTCGLSAGARACLDGLRERMPEADVRETGCIGLCSSEPMLDVQPPGKARLFFGRVQPDQLDRITAIARGTEQPSAAEVLFQQPGEVSEAWPGIPLMSEHPFFKHQQRQVLLGCGTLDPGSLDEALEAGGWAALADLLASGRQQDLCERVEQAGLRGRGGGGFPTGRKWRFARDTESTETCLICNADEGDPGAFMDRALIEGDPHRLLEGMAIAAFAIGARETWIYIRAEYPLAIKRLEDAIVQAKAAGLIGDKVLGSSFSFDVHIKQGAGAFVCGEETALIQSIEGRRGMPRPRPPYPASRGLFGHPTIINNVETLANLPTLLGMGEQAFSAQGTEGSKGTKIFALSGKVERTGLVEVVMGKPVSLIVNEIGGGVPDGRKLKAIQIGGPSGGCIPADHLDLPVDYESLKNFGAMIGSGGLVVMDEETCMVDVARFFMEFIQRESCGKCIPCREGTKQLKAILDSICTGRRNEQGAEALDRIQGVMQIERLARVIQDTSLCGLGQSAPNPVLSTLKWFREEYEAHIFARRCPARVCTDLLVYTIAEDACNGCTACARICPTGAISGERKSVHAIDQERCTGCGECLRICRKHAVEVN